jgi:hypothetical protein
MLFPSKTIPAFLHHISDVVLLRSEKKMLDLYAWRIVAMMANKKPIRNSPMNNRPCESVSVVSVKASIARDGCPSCPQPASIVSFVNEFPEANLWANNIIRRVTQVRAILATSSSYVALMFLEFYTTVPANALNRRHCGQFTRIATVLSESSFYLGWEYQKRIAALLTRAFDFGRLTRHSNPLIQGFYQGATAFQRRFVPALYHEAV